MTLKLVRDRARELGIKNITKYRKEKLIRVIQETEGNSPCFKGIHHCGEHNCLWRPECQS